MANSLMKRKKRWAGLCVCLTNYSLQKLHTLNLKLVLTDFIWQALSLTNNPKPPSERIKTHPRIPRVEVQGSVRKHLHSSISKS